jgi:biotin-dependent carboxylase-like uncharacterized protein
MSILVEHPGMLTTAQDLGRWGYQAMGIPVAGAMDPLSLRIGNLLLGNPENAAALECTLLGPTLRMAGEKTLLALTGADLGMKINGKEVPAWKVLELFEGDRISFSGPQGKGCRGYLCFAGGIEVPPLLGSRSTYLRGKLGGVEGRALQKGDFLSLGKPDILWERCAGLACPEELRPQNPPGGAFRVILGPQEEYFTDAGKKTFFSSEYVVSSAADRMGFRLEGPKVEHREGADIISDAIPPGAIQVPGHGEPIVMMADRQTTGGYAKIGLLAGADFGRFAQKIPGDTVRFTSISLSEGRKLLEKQEETLRELERLRASHRSRPQPEAGESKEPEIKGIAPETPHSSAKPLRGRWHITVSESHYYVEWEEL